MEEVLAIVKNVKKCNTNVKKYIVYFATIIFSLVYIFGLNFLFSQNLTLFQNKSNVIKARVLEIISIDTNEYQLGLNDTHTEVTIYFKAKILSGDKKGKIVTAAQQIDDMYAGSLEKIEVNKKILLIEVNYFEAANYLMTDYVRSDYLIIFGLFFIIFLIIFGHKKGLNTLISLLFTCLAIFLVFIPAVLDKQNIYLWSIITCCFVIIVTLILINGLSKKTLCSMLGCFMGVLMTAILTLMMSKIMRLTGIIDEQSYYLQLLDTQNPFDLKAIVFSGIIIGAVGAIMDVAVSISASLLEVYEKSKEEDKNFKSLMKSGITIGRDMMGTMSNTLVMAYIGNSLSTTLLLLVYSGSILELLNKEMIIVELLQILVGSFGLLLTIPFTSMICSLIYCKTKKLAIFSYCS